MGLGTNRLGLPRPVRGDRPAPRSLPARRGVGLMSANVRGGEILSLSSHLATTRHAPSLYPFQAEAPLPAVGPVMGIDVLSGGPFSFDPFALYPRVLTNPNVLVLGSIGSG